LRMFSRRQALAFSVLPLWSKTAAQTDVLIYGATPAGLAAAQAVCRQGLKAVVVEPSRHIGGLVTGGISCTDTGTPHWVGGLSAEFFDSLAAANRQKYPNPQPPKMLFRGQALDWRVPRNWDFEPQTAFAAFESWVKKAGHPVIRQRRLAGVRSKGGRIQSIRLSDGSEWGAKVFLDASYEGDLLRQAGVSSSYGRESRSEHNESLAGTRDAHFRANYSEEYLSKPGIEYTHHGQFSAEIPARSASGNLVWGVDKDPLPPVGSADRRIQAYCFRLIVTQRPDLLVPWPKPRRYELSRYELLLRYVLAHPGISFARLVHFAAIPNGKFDLNASGPFSIDYVGGNTGYCQGTYSERERIYQDHLDYQQGFLWFLAHDERVPKLLRDEVNSWGLCRDEYPDNGHWPIQMYIRESNRLVGEYLMTEADILSKKTKEDSVGMGSFVLDSHWVRRFVDGNGNVRLEGHLDESIQLANAPYEISFRSLLPKRAECQNLLVPVCVSATHVAICTIRMEPVYMMLGHAAGLAASMAARSGAAVQDVEYRQLQALLLREGGVLKREHARKI
jgi:hypothetical protein